MLSLRPATADDAERLLAWRNDPAVRSASLQQDPIPASTHVAWLQGKLVDPACELLIVEADGAPVGQVRIEADDGGRAEVHIALAAGLAAVAWDRRPCDSRLSAPCGGARTRSSRVSSPITSPPCAPSGRPVSRRPRVPPSWSSYGGPHPAQMSISLPEPAERLIASATATAWAPLAMVARGSPPVSTAAMKSSSSSR